MDRDSSRRRCEVDCSILLNFFNRPWCWKQINWHAVYKIGHALILFDARNYVIHLRSMKTTLFNFLLITAILVSTVTCKHKCEDNPEAKGCPQCEQDQNIESMKDFYFFRTGSYWIYEELHSGAKDTVKVYFDETGLNGSNAFWKMYTESTYYDHLFHYKYEESFSTYCRKQPECNCRQIGRAKLRPGELVAEETIFLFPMIVGDFIFATAGSPSIVAEYIPNATIGNYSFGETYLWNVGVCGTEDINHVNYDDGVATTFYVSKHYFIIRKLIPSYDQDWHLIESHLIQ